LDKREQLGLLNDRLIGMEAEEGAGAKDDTVSAD
jgi:hypothetical protein